MYLSLDRKNRENPKKFFEYKKYALKQSHFKIYLKNDIILDMSDNKNQKVVTRFAPSPTGFMHIGGIRTAIYAYLWARKNNGTFILRIEDTDKEREVAGSIDHIKESLAWFGIDFDYGPGKDNPFGSAIQSERLETYKDFANKLIDKGLAYPDPFKPEEVEIFRKKAEDEKRPFLFRDYRPETFSKWDGTRPLRFKVPEIKRYSWSDAVRGELSAGPEALDDFILIKSDGYPTYNFAHIVDDFNMSVNCVIRGEEFISSTPRFLSLYDALSIPYPTFVTVPSILRNDRTKKLGKRDGAKDILEYRKDGYLPEAMFNFLTLTGFNPGGEKEVFTKSELIELFDLSKIQKAGALFNEEKLEWINKEHIKLLSKEDQFENIKKYLPEDIKNLSGYSDDLLRKITPLLIDRISKWSDLSLLVEAGEVRYFFQKPDFKEADIVWKDDNIENAKKHLRKVLEILEGANESDFETPEQIKTLVWSYAESEGKGNVLWPLRMTLSGEQKSPDPFTLLSVLGKEESVERVRCVLKIL
jgi:glutamyl-tRNA synthetase